MIPDRLDLEATEATVFIQDIHSGPGLNEVPRGTIKNLRVIAYDFGYIGYGTTYLDSVKNFAESYGN